MSWTDLGRMLVEGHRLTYEPLYPSFADILLGVDLADQADAVIFGVPFDGGTFRHIGANAGPAGIRQAFSVFRTFNGDLEIDIADYLKVADIGNVDLHWSSYEEAFRGIDAIIRKAVAGGQVPIMLGGDHSISYQGIKSFREAVGGPIGVIWIDNHLDTMETFHGDRYYCGCPLFYLLEERLVDPARLCLMGPRGFTQARQMWEAARRFGFRIIKMDEIMLGGIAAAVEEALAIATAGTNRVYLTVDIDSADAVYAPGTEVAGPGGLTARELMYAVRRIADSGAEALDITEVAPPIDVASLTSKLAAEVLLCFLAGMASRRRRARG
jgi:formimidoylglutamase